MGKYDGVGAVRERVNMLNRWMRRSAVSACFVATLVALSSGAQAQWIWQDANGQRVISDMPPPASVPDKNILRRPGPARPVPAADPAQVALPGASTNAPAAPSQASAQSPAAPATPGTHRTPGTTATPAAAKPAADSPEAQKAAQERQAIEKRNVQIMADNCQRARDAMSTLQSNRRLAIVNDKGQSVKMDEAMRKAETERLQQIIKDNCKN
jgi:hypothetical protein